MAVEHHACNVWNRALGARQYIFPINGPGSHCTWYMVIMTPLCVSGLYCRWYCAQQFHSQWMLVDNISLLFTICIWIKVCSCYHNRAMVTCAKFGEKISFFQKRIHKHMHIPLHRARTIVCMTLSLQHLCVYMAYIWLMILYITLPRSIHDCLLWWNSLDKSISDLVH